MFNVLITIDGIPLRTSSKIDLWCTLASISVNPSVRTEFVIGVHHGKSKEICNLNDFPQFFVNKMKEIEANRIEIDG